jgi:hypothetical protein
VAWFIEPCSSLSSRPAKCWRWTSMLSGSMPLAASRWVSCLRPARQHALPYLHIHCEVSIVDPSSVVIPLGVLKDDDDSVKSADNEHIPLLPWHDLTRLARAFC